MLFRVTRTSGGEPPVPEAFEGIHNIVDRRIFKSEGEHDARVALYSPSSGKKWRDHGHSHGYWYNDDGTLGGIQRLIGPHKCWLVELSSIEEFADFVKKHGDIVVSPHFSNVPTIEIYDDYRE